MSVMENATQTERNTDRFTTRTVGLARFLNVPDDKLGNYVRVFFDKENRQIRAYRQVGKSGKQVNYWRVVIENVGFRLYVDSDHLADEPERYNLHDKHADTFLTWLDTLKAAKGDIQVTATWYESNNAQIHKDSGLSCETLQFEWDNNNRKRVISIDSNYKVNAHKIAAWK